MYLCSINSSLDFNVHSTVQDFARIACSVIEGIAFYSSSSSLLLASNYSSMPAHQDRLQMALSDLLEKRQKSTTDV